MLRKVLRTAVVAGALVALVEPALALSISDVVVAPTAANSLDLFTPGGANPHQIASATTFTASPGPVPDVSGATVFLDARYAALLAADREHFVASQTQTQVSEYTIAFTVDNPSGSFYQIDIDTRRLGALTLVDDGTGDASATLGAVTGLLDGGADPDLALLAVGPLTGSGGGYQAFDQASGTLTLLENAVSRTYTLTFTWSSTVTSARDEAAVRMGIAGSLGVATADDYPGVGPRVAADDGHFVNVLVTLVPEPPLALLWLPAVAFAFRRATAR